jgi:hypothetical protein
MAQQHLPVVTLMDDTPMYAFPAKPGPFSSQQLWNEWDLRAKYKGKAYDVAGDEVFTLNPNCGLSFNLGRDSMRPRKEKRPLNEIEKKRTDQ